MRSPSACNSMSSQTHPQNVQVAFFTTVSSIPCFPQLPADLAVRTGRDDERSAERTALAAALDAARHEAPGVDLLPGRHLARLGLVGEVGGLLDALRRAFRSFGLDHWISSVVGRISNPSVLHARTDWKSVLRVGS